jgi:hypothetical protein
MIVPNIPAAVEGLDSDDEDMIPPVLSTAASEDNLKMGDEGQEEPILATTFTDATRFKILKDSRVIPLFYSD